MHLRKVYQYLQRSSTISTRLMYSYMDEGESQVEEESQVQEQTDESTPAAEVQAPPQKHPLQGGQILGDKYFNLPLSQLISLRASSRDPNCIKYSGPRRPIIPLYERQLGLNLNQLTRVNYSKMTLETRLVAFFKTFRPEGEVVKMIELLTDLKWGYNGIPSDMTQTLLSNKTVLEMLYKGHYFKQVGLDKDGIEKIIHNPLFANIIYEQLVGEAQDVDFEDIDDMEDIEGTEKKEKIEKIKEKKETKETEETNETEEIKQIEKEVEKLDLLQKRRILERLEKEVKNLNFVTHPLKLYWSLYFLAHGKYSEAQVQQLQHCLIGHLMKIKVNGEDIPIDTKFYFLVGNGRLIINDLLKLMREQKDDLEGIMPMFFISLLVCSRVRTILLEQKGGKNIDALVDFNDLFELGKFNLVEEQFQELFQNIIPKNMFHHAPEEFMIYQLALKNHQNKSSGIQPIRSELDKHLNQKFLKLQYEFKNDPLPIQIELISKISKQEAEEIQDRVNTSDQFHQTLAQELGFRIVQGQYSFALKIYKIEKLLELGTDISSLSFQDVERIEQRSRGMFKNPEHHSLYVLSQCSKKEAPHIKSVDFSPALLKSSIRFDTKQNAQTNLDQYEDYNNKEVAENRLQICQSNTIWEYKKTPNQNYKNFRSRDESQQIDGRNRRQVESKPLFAKKNKSSFSTTKNQILDQEIDKQKEREKTQRNYEQYLEAMKQIDEEKTQTFSIDFSFCENADQAYEQLIKSKNEINEKNIEEIIHKYSNIKGIGSVLNLIKYAMVKGQKRRVEIPPNKNLVIQIETTFGSIDKDYTEYIENCEFIFPFPVSLYDTLFSIQEENYHRKQFKTLLTHFILHSSEINFGTLIIICQICKKQKIGITLLEFVTLLTENNIKMSLESLQTVCGSLQFFASLEKDLIIFLRRYCPIFGYKINVNLFRPYIYNLVATDQFDKLKQLYESLRYQTRPVEYQYDEKLTPQNNLKAEKIHKEQQRIRYGQEILCMSKLATDSFHRKTEVPLFLVQLFTQYIENKQTLTSQEYGVGLLIYSGQQQLLAQWLDRIEKEEKLENNDIYVFECGLRILILFGKKMKKNAERILTVTLYKNRFDLQEKHLLDLGRIFKFLDVSTTYCQYLEFILRHQPPTTQQIKKLYYSILNASYDDYAKPRMNGILDFIFNPKRQVERKNYKRIKEEDEEKIEALKKMQLQRKKNQVGEKHEEKKEVPQANQEPKKTKKQKKEQKKTQEAEVSKKKIQGFEFEYKNLLSKKKMRNKNLGVWIERFLQKRQETEEPETKKKQKGKKK